MLCSDCGAPLQIADSKFAFENDHTPDLPTELYSVLTMVCVNPKCSNYCGPNLTEPLKVAQVVRNKVN